MIIVEGPDGGGKTTLAKQLAYDLKLSIAPRVVGADTKAMVDLRLWVEENLDLGFHEKIYDRHRLISEPIYGAILHRIEPGFDDVSWITAMMSNFYAIDPIVIYCIPPKVTMIHNVLTGDDDNSAIEAKAEIIYGAYLARAAIDVANEIAFIYDYTRHGYESLLQAVEHDLKDR